MKRTILPASPTLWLLRQPDKFLYGCSQPIMDMYYRISTYLLNPLPPFRMTRPSMNNKISRIPIWTTSCELVFSFNCVWILRTWCRQKWKKTDTVDSMFLCFLFFFPILDCYLSWQISSRFSFDKNLKRYTFQCCDFKLNWNRLDILKDPLVAIIHLLY